MNLFLAAFLLPAVFGDNILDELTKNKEISLLAKLSEVAGLEDLFTSADPLTVFAPTNEAFNKLLPAARHNLYQDKELLKKVILYHTLPGKLEVGDISDDEVLTTKEGSKLRTNVFKMAEALPSFITVNGALVVHSRPVSNGVIHVISDIFFPIPELSINQMLELDPRFSSLMKVVEKAGMTETLATGGPFTFFAPTEEAFKGFEETPNEDECKELVLRHMVTGTRFAARLVNQTHVSDSGETLKTFLEDPGEDYLTVECDHVKGRLMEPDLLVTNGVVHAINKIL